MGIAPVVPRAAGGGISRAYARNVTDFLKRAKKANQLVIRTTQWLPSSYGALIGDSPLVDDVTNPIRQGDTRDLRTHAVIERSALDLVDIHLYAGDVLPLSRLMESWDTDEQSELWNAQSDGGVIG